jgi:hypothetical protein
MISIDGFEIFSRIAANAGAFPDLRVAVSNAARDVIVKYLKGKETKLDNVRAMRRVGSENFGLLPDMMKDQEVKSLVTRLDRHNTEMKAVTHAKRREQLHLLADGGVEPAEKAVRCFAIKGDDDTAQKAFFKARQRLQYVSERADTSLLLSTF